MHQDKTLLQILKEQRKYAHHFEWPDKQIKERGVVKTLIDEMEKKGEVQWTDLRIGPHPNHAPDCVATNSRGDAVAIEVTELVSGRAIEMTKAGQNVYYDWEPAEVIGEIQKRISRKDTVAYAGGPYAAHVLVIHTDEIALDHETYLPLLGKASFSASTIAEVYFLFSYNPGVKGYPFVRLQIRPD